MIHRRPGRDAKQEALKQEGVHNPHPEAVTDPLFIERDFFDARDLVQVKYEMLRRAERDGASITETSRAFGVSRPTFYETRRAFERGGLLGLVPAKRGPQKAHKLADDVMVFVESILEERGPTNATDLARAIWEKFGLKVHPRSVERALARRKKGA